MSSLLCMFYEFSGNYGIIQNFFSDFYNFVNAIKVRGSSRGAINGAKLGTGYTFPLERDWYSPFSGFCMNYRQIQAISGRFRRNPEHAQHDQNAK